MLLGIPIFIALLVMLGPFVAVAIPALPALPQWPAPARRTRTSRPYNGWAAATWA